jgi:hypothetical protein
LDKAIIIKLIFIEGSLLIESDWISGPQLFNRDYRLFDFLYFDVSLNMSFKSIEKEAIGTFLYFSYLDIFWLLY